MIKQAKAFAKKAHANHKRKISKEPYITHPIRVAERLEKAGCSEDVIAAAYLHDVVEDTPYTMADITERFGDRVADLVAGHTEDKSKSWQERKLHTINLIKDTEKEVKYLIVADRLDNLLELENNLIHYGEQIWNRFNAGYEKQRWYHESIAKNMYTGLNQEDIPSFFYEFEKIVKRVFKN